MIVIDFNLILYLTYVESTRCPSYQLLHKEKEDLRKMDISLIGIFSTSDNLHD